jgi:alginate O-acetyltransferase complex protein AlgI
LWHGASWNFIIWGLYFGLFISVETLIGAKRMRKIPLLIRHIYSKLVLLVGFGIFYFEDLSELVIFLKTAVGLGANGLIGDFDRMTLVNNVYLLTLAALCCLPIFPALKKLCGGSYPVKVAFSVASVGICAGLLVVSSILLVNSTSQPFLYLRF